MSKTEKFETLSCEEQSKRERIFERETKTRKKDKTKHYS